MLKKSLSVILSALLLFTLAIPAFASGATAADIAASPFSDFTLEYSDITKTARVNLVLTRDINVTVAKYYSDLATIYDFATGNDAVTADAMQTQFKAQAALGQLNEAASESGISSIASQTFDFSALIGADFAEATVAEAFKYITDNNLITSLPADLDMLTAKELAQGKYYNCADIFETNFRTNITLPYFASLTGGSKDNAESKFNDFSFNFRDASNLALRTYATAADDLSVKKDITNYFGENLSISLDYTDGVNDLNRTISAYNIDYLYNCDTDEPCCYLLEELLDAIDNNIDCVVTLEAGTRYAFSLDLTDDEMANIDTMTATVVANELADDGSYAENILLATPEEKTVAVTGIEDGEWLESEEPIIVTADGIDHLLSANPYSAANGLIPVRWYLDGNVDEAVEIENGEYTFALNSKRMEGGDHTLTVVFEHEYFETADTQTEDSITESVTIDFTANTFKFAEVASLLARIEGMIISILTPLIEALGGLFG